jgi:hypothetical protein
LDPTLGIDLLHTTFILLFTGLGLGLIALDTFDVLGVVNVP